MSLKNRFEKRGIVENEKEEVLAEERGHAVEIDAPKKVQEYDPRTLYERLKEVRDKKEDEFTEKTKLGNLIKKLDSDEISFIRSQKEDAERRKQETQASLKSALDEFRSAVQQKQTAATAAVDVPLLPVPVNVAKEKAAGGATTKSAAKNAKGVSGLIVRKRKAEDDGATGGTLAASASQSASASASASGAMATAPVAKKGCDRKDTKKTMGLVSYASDSEDEARAR